MEWLLPIVEDYGALIFIYYSEEFAVIEKWMLC